MIFQGERGRFNLRATRAGLCAPAPMLSLALALAWLMIQLACAGETSIPASDPASSTSQQRASGTTANASRAADVARRPAPLTGAAGGARGSTTGFTLLDNRRMQVSYYLGQVVVLDFYATWCPPCRIETPHLVELQRRYGSQGLNIIGLNVGGPEDRYQVPAFVEEFKIQYALGYPDAAMSDELLGDDDRIPQTFVFDRKGRLIKRFISYDDAMPAELERVIQAALAERAN